MIKVSKLTKKYGNFIAVKDISFKLEEGKCLGLIGSNGAGKSTTIKMIIGLISPTSGSIVINNQNMSTNNNNIKKIIGYMPEESALYEDLDAISFLNFFGDLYNVKKPAKRIKELLSELNLKNKPIGSMSKGMKRKLLIARSLINNPKILIYDEPASGLDPETTQFIIDYILKLKKKGKIIIITSHNLVHVEKISNNIIILDNGKVIFHDTVKHIKNVKKYILTFKDIQGKIKRIEANDINDVNKTIKKMMSKKDIIVNLEEKEKHLENLFLELVQNK